MSEDEDFEIACRAFGLFTVAEKKAALEKMRTLRFASMSDRFFEAVHRVIVEGGSAEERRADDQYFRFGARYPGQ
jgi:hypothetical protein